LLLAANVIFSKIQAQALQPGYAVMSCLPAEDDVTLVIMDITQVGTEWCDTNNHSNTSNTVTKEKSFTVADFDGNWIWGIEIDERDGTIYASTSNLYSGTASAPTAIGQDPMPATVYKIDAMTCQITALATLPGDLGIGYITSDTICNTIFATNMDDGKIYAINATSGAIVDTWDFGAADPADYVLPALGDRVLGVDYNYADGRLYYSVWSQNKNESIGNNTIRSIALDASCKFVPSSDQLEITLYDNIYGHQQPVGDIEFNDAGTKVLLAETGFWTTSSYGIPEIIPSAHDSRMMGWELVAGVWQECPVPTGNLSNATYDIGRLTTYNGNNSRGGAAWAYKTVDGCSFTDDEEFVVATGDYLKSVSIYGFQFLPASGGSINNSILIDGDPTSSQQKYVYSDIEIYTPQPTYDVELNKIASTATANVGDNVSFEIEVINNSCDTVHNVIVSDPLPAGATYVAHAPAAYVYSAGTGLWTVGDMNPNARDTITITMTLGQEGTYYNLAEVESMDEEDEDSTPANREGAEDDIAAACVSVPVLLPCDEPFIITAESGYGSYIWYKDGTAISGETGQSLTVTAAGDYTYSVMVGGCEVENCCPITVQTQECCPADNCSPISLSILKGE